MSALKNTSGKKRNRSYMNRSPLDRLPETIKHEMRMRCQSTATYQEIAAWLKETQGLRVSKQSVCDWYARQLDSGWQPQGPKQIVFHEGLEIVVTAPGATEVRVAIRPLSPGAPGK